jgi:hypothetical protein
MGNVMKYMLAIMIFGNSNTPVEGFDALYDVGIHSTMEECQIVAHVARTVLSDEWHVECIDMKEDLSK